MNNNNEQEREAYMGFSVSKEIQDEIVKMVCSRDWDQDEAGLIPGADGLVLVSQDSKAYLERKDSPGVIMIPVKMRTESCGTEAKMTFYVCTK